MVLKINKTSKPNTVQATVTTDVTDNLKKEQVSSVTEKETVEVPENLTAPSPEPQVWCQVGFDGSYTHNLGNYQSARVGIHLMIPCLHGEIDAVYDFAKSWVDARLNTVVDEFNQGG